MKISTFSWTCIRGGEGERIEIVRSGEGAVMEGVVVVIRGDLGGRRTRPNFGSDLDPKPLPAPEVLELRDVGKDVKQAHFLTYNRAKYGLTF